MTDALPLEMFVRVPLPAVIPGEKREILIINSNVRCESLKSVTAIIGSFS